MTKVEARWRAARLAVCHFTCSMFPLQRNARVTDVEFQISQEIQPRNRCSRLLVVATTGGRTKEIDHEDRYDDFGRGVHRGQCDTGDSARQWSGRRKRWR